MESKPKRRRMPDSRWSADEEMDTESEGPSEPTAQSETLWFEDGNIVIQAEEAQFKVHRGVLSKHSPVFADLFQVPQPKDESSVDGCPVVHLSDESDDVMFMLSALYGDSEPLRVDGVLYFNPLRAMVRLGRKYQIDHLRDEGLRCLKREFPRTLEDFDKSHPDDYNNFYPIYDEEEADTVGTIFATINLAQECSIRSILPALYLLSTNVKLEDFLYHESASTIPYDAMRSCIYGREKLLQEWTSKGCGAPSPGIDCLSMADCKATTLSIVKLLTSKPPPDLSAVLLPWKKFIDTWKGLRSLNKHLCDRCKRDVQGSHDGWRRVAWQALPSYFKLGTWENLRDFES